MYTYNEQPILDMTSNFPEETWTTLDREITQGLVHATTSFLSPGYELTRGDAELGLYDHRYKDVGIAEAELEPWEKDFFSQLTFAQKHRYLRYAKGAYHLWSVCLPLTTNAGWARKMSPEGKNVTEEAKKLFPRTLDFAYSLPMFESIGRVCIFGVDPNQHVTCHRDFNPEKWPINNELLMFSPRGNKRFFVYDADSKVKHFVPAEARAYIFHDLNYHGVETLPYFTYTLRVDGLYTEEFRSKLVCNRPAKHPSEFSKPKTEISSGAM